MSNRVWFITGSSRGFGREWAEAALKQGEKVAATARNIDDLNDLVETYGDLVLPIQLDANDYDADFAAVKQAFDHFGQLDVVVNNAGYGLFGMIEEVSEKEARQQMETNFFGALWITQAAIPLMREQGSGHIIQISSIGGVAAFPSIGIYHASKWALEAFSDTLNSEVSQFGIKVTIVEPGGYSTDWAGSSATQSTQMDVYKGTREQLAAMMGPDAYANMPGPAKTADALLTLVNAENPPLRVFLGKGNVETIQQIYEARLNVWEQWKDFSESVG